MLMSIMTALEPRGPTEIPMTKTKPKNNTKISGGCPDCTQSTYCGGYHVYVVELDEDTTYDFYVGYTGKTVLQRRIDNWEKYASQGNGPKLVRNHWAGMRMDLVPEHSIVSPTTEDAKRLEAELADDLREQGFTVKGPTNRGRL